MNLIIRDYQDNDYEQIVSNLKEATLFNPHLDTKEVLSGKMKHSPGSILVAEQEGEVVGSVFIIFDKWQSFVYRLAVKEAYRKQGVGSALMRALEDRLRDFGALAVSGTVRENHPHLEKYYQELGYELAPIKHRYIHKKLNEN